MHMMCYLIMEAPRMPTTDSIDRFIELSSELARIALECPTCRELFKQAIQNQIIPYEHYRQGGGSLSDFIGQAMNVRKDG
jgi:hypothetical protein